MPTLQTDYSTVIRAEIERDVEALIEEIESYTIGRGWEPVKPIVADRVEIGYMVNSHRGHALYKDGDVVCGLLVRIDMCNPRTVSVCADEVEFQNEEVDEDGDFQTIHDTLNVVVSATH